LTQDKYNLESEKRSALSNCELLTDHVTSLQTELRQKNELVDQLKCLLTQAKLVRTQLRLAISPWPNY